LQIILKILKILKILLLFSNQYLLLYFTNPLKKTRTFFKNHSFLCQYFFYLINQNLTLFHIFRIRIKSTGIKMDRKTYKKFLHDLPSKPYILGKNNFFISSVFVPFVFLKGEYHFLLQKRTVDIRQGGEICFPGGGFDPKKDKNYQETAIRETAEELGIKRDIINIDGVFDTLVNPNGKIVNTFVGKLLIDSLNELNIHEKEVEKILTAPVSFFLNNAPKEYKIKIHAQSYYLDKDGKEISILPVKQLGLPEKYEKTWGHFFRKIYVYEYENEIIWGITAEIIYELVKLL